MTLIAIIVRSHVFVYSFIRDSGLRLGDCWFILAIGCIFNYIDHNHCFYMLHALCLFLCVFLKYLIVTEEVCGTTFVLWFSVERWSYFNMVIVSLGFDMTTFRIKAMWIMTFLKIWMFPTASEAWTKYSGCLRGLYFMLLFVCELHVPCNNLGF